MSYFRTPHHSENGFIEGDKMMTDSKAGMGV